MLGFLEIQGHGSKHLIRLHTSGAATVMNVNIFKTVFHYRLGEKKEKNCDLKRAEMCNLIKHSCLLSDLLHNR
ncbi:CLUMA_CG017592, isoform A [Clunio marinus]|uniref:CLUMA_CG017592, isoform A n=1 Tax=Clunio marinus TaxID=568069 RepID=A0A1J1IWC6_9DIPT|nr:CLUMA_CG017592, isoform A [Clunio marinus]